MNSGAIQDGFPDGEPAYLVLTILRKAYQAIKELVPQAHVVALMTVPIESFPLNILIEVWSTRNIQPDFLSLYCYAPLMREVNYNERGTKKQKWNTGN